MTKLINSEMKYTTDEQVTVVGTVYINGAPALLLRSIDGEPIAHATINMSDKIALPDMHVVIKDYAENEGVLQTLIEGGIVEDTGNEVQHGHVKSRICAIVDLDMIDEIMEDKERAVSDGRYDS